MAFLGFANYTKPGKGVDKDAPEKKQFFLYWEIYFRKLWKLIQLGLLFLLFCIPIVTIGPAICAMQKVMKDFINGRGVFLFSDFFAAFKSNFLFGFLFGIVDAIIYFLMFVAINFYWQMTQVNTFYYVLAFLTLAALVTWTMMNLYMWVMIPILDMKWKPMLKNAFLLAVLGIKRNLICVIACLVYMAIVVIVFFSSMVGIIIGTLLFLFLLPATLAFTVEFQCYPVVNRYIINPYYERTGERRPDDFAYDPAEDDEVIFEDIGTQEIQAKPAASSVKTKRIK